MTNRHLIAVGVAVAAMVVALLPPVWIQATGDEVALEITPVDPLSLFRGNYVDLSYAVDVSTLTESRDLGWGQDVYVVFDDARPANPVRIAESPPTLLRGETCIRGVSRGLNGVDFPALEQFFVTSAEGAVLERQLSSLVAIVKTTGSCRALLHDLEPQ